MDELEHNDYSEPAKAIPTGLECPQGYPEADWAAKTDDEKRAWWALNNIAGGAK